VARVSRSRTARSDTPRAPEHHVKADSDTVVGAVAVTAVPADERLKLSLRQLRGPQHCTAIARQLDMAARRSRNARARSTLGVKRRSAEAALPTAPPIAGGARPRPRRTGQFPGSPTSPNRERRAVKLGAQVDLGAPYRQMTAAIREATDFTAACGIDDRCWPRGHRPPDLHLWCTRMARPNS
jgi:hypothetical protein